METGEPARRRGPPKAFDIEAALRAATVVFWRKGFEGASLDDLTEAMGINRPSLYATFGDKLSLFSRAIARYVEPGRAALAGGEGDLMARQFVETLLRGQADFYTARGQPAGCFLIQSAMASASEAARHATQDNRRKNEAALRRYFERAAKRGELPSLATAAGLTAYFASVVNGMAVRAADGATRADLYGVIDIALAFWAATPPDRTPAGPKRPTSGRDPARPRPSKKK